MAKRKIAAVFLSSVLLISCGESGSSSKPLPKKIQAINDNMAMKSGDVGNLLANDKLADKAVEPTEVNFSLINSTLPSFITISSSGLVSISSGAIAGEYKLDYRICEMKDPTNCASANGKIIITAEPILSIADTLQKLEQLGEIPVLNRDATILGVDTNNNGVRDDIDNYVNSLPDTSSQKQALLQSSKSLNSIMTVDLANQTQVIEAANKNSAAVKCIYSVYDAETAADKSSDIHKYTINTEERINASAKFDLAVSGNSFVLPQGDSCEN